MKGELDGGKLQQLGTWLEVRCEYIALNGGETLHGWKWDNTHGTWMQVRQDMNGSKTHIMIHGWVSDWTWVDTICSFRDPREGETWPGWRWDAYIETCIEMSCDLDRCEIIISRQVSIISTHVHPGDKSPLSKLQNCISVPLSTHINAIQVSSLSKSYLTYIWVLVSTLYTYHLIWLSSPLHPFHISPAA